MKLTTLTEARYSEPEIRRLTGILFIKRFDPTEIRHDGISITIRCDDKPISHKQSLVYSCVVVSAKNINEYIDIEEGAKLRFTRDKQGWILVNPYKDADHVSWALQST